MGIKCLNKFFIENCAQDTIEKIKLHTLTGKIIAVDTSIYMYRFSGQDVLLENFYLMISLFREYEIIPIFIFDGKAPPEKMELIRLRNEIKKEAKQKYMKLSQELANSTDELNTDIISEMETLKKQFVRIRPQDVVRVKQLMTSYGVSFYDAQGEADRLCAQLVISGKAWACLSDDMDMFVYGCQRVIRHFSLVHKTVLLYDLPKILSELEMSMDQFRQIAVISGTDYNMNDVTSLHETIKWFMEYKRSKNRRNGNETPDFYKWLVENTKYIKNSAKLNEVYKMFCIEDGTNDAFIKECDDIKIEYRNDYDVVRLREIISGEGFVFA